MGVRTLNLTLRDVLSHAGVERGLQVIFVGLLGVGIVTGNGALLVNGILAIPIVFSPTLIAWRFDHEVDIRLSIWIAVAAIVHLVGFLGPYQVQSGLLSWYDQVAHAITASFVAGVGYAVVVALDRSSTRVRFPNEFRVVFTVCFILAFGVAWEIVEFGASGLASALSGGEGVLVQYGKDDIVYDLAFNTVAAALVALWGTSYFRDIVTFTSSRLFRQREL